jgi:hypothetical protein
MTTHSCTHCQYLSEEEKIDFFPENAVFSSFLIEAKYFFIGKKDLRISHFFFS